MQTKKQILHSITKDGPTFLSDDSFDGDPSEIYDAMDQWAEQQIPIFIKWAFEDGWRVNMLDNKNMKWTKFADNGVYHLTTTELYKLFNSEK